MKLEEYKETYEVFSGKLSDICRSLSFMGFGVVWILIGGLEGFKSGEIPNTLKWVMGGLVVTLTFDFIQYIYQTIVWYCYFSYLEKRFGPKFGRRVSAPSWLNVFSWLLFWLKISIMLISYLLLLKYIILLII